MMKKIFKTVITLALLLCVLSTGVLAVEEESEAKTEGVFVSNSNSDDGIMPLYLYIARFDCNAIIEDGNVVCITSVGGYEGITTQIRIEMRLQKKGFWGYSDIAIWSDGFDAASGEMIRTYPYESGAKYKLYVYIEVYHGSDFESDSFTSDPFPK